MKYEKGSFIVVPSKELLRGLKPQTQVLFMWLCSYANTTGKCFPSKALLATDCGMSARSVLSSANELISIGLLVRQERKDKTGHNKTNVYSLMMGGGTQEVRGGEQEVRGEGAPRARGTQSSELNPPNSTTSQGDVADGHMINRFIDGFKEVNPSFARLYKLRGQRDAARRLIQQHGLEKMLGIIAFLPRSNKNKYAPTITTPDQLETKLGVLFAWAEKEKSSPKGKEII